jgi:hypothetical protein
MWLHGTNQTIKKFIISSEIQGINTGSESSDGLIYFTKDTALASDYADGAANKLYPENHNGHIEKLNALEKEYNSLMDKRMFDEADAACIKLESYESSLSENKSGQCIYSVNLTPDKFKVFDFKNHQWGSKQTQQILAYAMKNKLDAIFICNVVDKIKMQSKLEPTDIAIVLNDDCINISFIKDSQSITPSFVRKVLDKNLLNSNNSISY